MLRDCRTPAKRAPRLSVLRCDFGVSCLCSHFGLELSQGRFYHRFNLIHKLDDGQIAACVRDRYPALVNALNPDTPSNSAAGAAW